MASSLGGSVVAVARDGKHRFSKLRQSQIELIAGHGVAGDAHCGTQVRHRSRVAVDPGQPNLRQVHLIQSELFKELAAAGYAVAPANLGENITTAGIDLLALPRGTVLTIGDAEIEVTGLRNPCAQIDRFQKGLLAQLALRGEGGAIVRKCGIMGIIRRGGAVCPGDAITASLPDLPHLALECV